MIKDELEKLYFQLRKEKKEKWHRVLPLGELIVDRWEKARYLKFGEGSSVYDSAIVMGNVHVGKNTWIGPNTLLDGTGEAIQIGDNCDISAGVQIYTHDTVKRCLTGGVHEVDTGAVKIGNNCYIAPMSLITKGVTLGEQCVVAAHSMVNKSYGDRAIIAGIPAKQIGNVVIKGDEVTLEYYK